MKVSAICFSFLMVLLFSCKSEDKSTESLNVQEEIEKISEEKPNVKEEVTKEIIYAHAWEGKLGGKIPVFIHYTIKDSILSGQVTYLNTKARKPIRIIGEIQANNYYRILEFDKNALITGIWTLKIKGNSCTGTWFAPPKSGWYDPDNNKEFTVKATPSDSLIPEWNLSPNPNKLFGRYEYNYTKENGNVGHFTLNKLTDNRADFEILGISSAPGFNIASIEETDVDFEGGKDTQFLFKLSDSKDCDFKVIFYNDFATVRYTNGYCQTGYFGHNATVEGLFLKMK